MGIYLPGYYDRRVVLAGRDFLSQVRRICGSSLIGLWLLNEQSGATAKDYSGFGRDGSYTGVTFLQPGVNLLSNPGFETAGGGGADVFASWTEEAGDGAVERTITEGEFRSGVAAVKLTGGPTPATYPRVIGYGITIPWAQYNIDFWTRGDGINAGRSYAWDTFGAQTILPSITTGITGNVFAPINRPFQAPGGCTQVQLGLRCPNVNGGWACFDDTELYASQPNGMRGFTAPFWDGANDKLVISGAALTSLAAAFSGSEGYFGIWYRPGVSAVWTDGSQDTLISFAVNSDNYVTLWKSGTNNTLTWRYKAGGTLLSINIGGLSFTTWTHLGFSWSKSADQVIAYMNGTQVGSTQTGLGNWSGTLTTGFIGCDSNTPTNVVNGLLQAPKFCNRALSPAAIRALYLASLPVAA